MSGWTYSLPETRAGELPLSTPIVCVNPCGSSRRLIQCVRVGDGGRPAHPPKQKHRLLCCGWQHFPGRERSVTMLNQTREENTKISLSSFQDTVAFILSWCAECFPWPPNEAAKHRPLNISCIISLHRPCCPRPLSHISLYLLYPYSPGEELHLRLLVQKAVLPLTESRKVLPRGFRP